MPLRHSKSNSHELRNIKHDIQVEYHSFSRSNVKLFVSQSRVEDRTVELITNTQTQETLYYPYTQRGAVITLQVHHVLATFVLKQTGVTAVYMERAKNTINLCCCVHY